MTDNPDAAYDVRDPERNPWLIDAPGFASAYCAWLRTHGIDPDLTYRTEHHLIDAPFVRVYAYDLNEDGRRYVDEATRDIARCAPYDVLATTEPPKPEDYA